MKLNNTNKNALRAIVVIFVLLWVIQLLNPKKSYYSPVEIETVNEGSIFNLESKEECLGKSYYSDSRGGVCGGQEMVNGQLNYKMK